MVRKANLGHDLVQNIDRLQREVAYVYQKCVLPSWGGEFHGLTDALFGYMMGVFARIDLASAHWRGSYKNQSCRMIAFMDEYFGTDHEANSVAMQICRNKLMHTAKPRYLHHPKSRIHYEWLLHWWEHLPKENHFTFDDSADPRRILNLGLVYFIENLREAVERYRSDLSSSSDLQKRYQDVENELSSYEFKLM